MSLPDPTLSPAFLLATDDPGLVGYRLAQLRREQALTPQQQAAVLGISVYSLAGLCLCLQPRNLADVKSIAARMRVEAAGMAALLGVRTP